MLNITLTNILGFTDDQIAFITKSLKTGLMVVQNPLWRQEVGGSSFSENRGYSGPQLIDLLNNTDLKITLKQFYSDSNTIAYTFVSEATTYFNEKYLSDFLKMPGVEGQAECFATIMHESMHQLGFLHKWFWHKSSTVPYAIEDITRDCYNKLVKDAP